MSQQGQSRFLLQLQANNVRRVLAPAIVARVAATHDHTITEVLQQGIMQLLALVFVSIDHRTTKPQLQAPAAIVFVVENQPICSLLSETSISQSLTECTNISIGAVLLRFNLRNDQRGLDSKVQLVPGRRIRSLPGGSGLRDPTEPRTAQR